MISIKTRYDSLFQFWAAATPGSPEWLHLKAQAMAESDLDPNAVSPAGAMGLMQFMRPTWEEWVNVLGVRNPDPFNAEHSIRLAAAYMAWLLTKVGQDYRLSLVSYNWGIGNVRSWRSKVGRWTELPAETQRYVATVEQNLRELSAAPVPEVSKLPLAIRLLNFLRIG